MLLEHLSARPRVLLTTGRGSSEMLQKVARMGVPSIMSRSSPSNLSVQLAERWGITLIGYTRRDQFFVYAHPERLRGVAEYIQLECLEIDEEHSATLPFRPVEVLQGR